MDLVQHMTLDNMLCLREMWFIDCSCIGSLACLPCWLLAWECLVKASIHAKRAHWKKKQSTAHGNANLSCFFQNKIFSGFSQLSANYLYKATSMFSADTFHSGATGLPSPKRPKICLSEDTTTGMTCMIQYVVWSKSMYLFWSYLMWGVLTCRYSIYSTDMSSTSAPDSSNIQST